MSDSIARPLARRLRSGDWERLAGFTCSNGAWYEAEVEQFVRTRLRGYLNWRGPYLQSTCVILADPTSPAEILALGAHEIDDQQTEDGVAVQGSYLIVVAVRVDLQGALPDIEPFEDGRPVTLGRLLMQTIIDDLPDRPGLVHATVARDNARSPKLCDRIGPVDERPDTHAQFVHRLGRLG